MFNGSGAVGMEEADCAASVDQAVKWDRGGSRPAQGGGRRGGGIVCSTQRKYPKQGGNQDVC